MIINPDFFEHWKTKMLIELSHRPESPLWVQRLWAHCQTRKQWHFRELSQLALKSICGVTGEITPADWWDMLLSAGFTRVKGKTLIVHGWEEHNAKLVTNWENGRCAKKKPERSQPEAKTGGGGGDRYDRLDKIDKIDKKDAALAIYRAYPRQIGKQAALKAITKALLVVSAEVLLEKTTAYRNATNNFPAAERQFIPHPATWFNAGRYEDDPGEWFGKKSPGGGEAPAQFDAKAPHAHTGGLEVFEPEPAIPLPAASCSGLRAGQDKSSFLAGQKGGL